MSIFGSSGFFGSSGNLTNISGVQFSQEAENTKRITYTSTAGGWETVYTVPAGKNLFIGSIIFLNVGGGALTMRARLEATTELFRGSIIASDTEKIDYPIPVLATAGTVIEFDGAAANSIITILGWEA